MKPLLLIALLSMFNAGALADSIRFTESFTQRYECTTFEGESECDVHSYNSATLNATLRIPGLGGFDFESTDSVELTLGPLSYSFTFAEAEDESAQDNPSRWMLVPAAPSSAPPIPSYWNPAMPANSRRGPLETTFFVTGRSSAKGPVRAWKPIWCSISPWKPTFWSARAL